MIYNMFFSPTGGTKKAADGICGAMKIPCTNIDLIKEPKKVTAFTGEDICVISVPSYGGRVPGVCAERLAGLCADGTRAVIVAVFGNRAIDDTLTELCDIVMACGFRVIAAVEAVAEHSLARMYASGRPDADDLSELGDFAGHIAEKLRTGSCEAPAIPGSRPYKEYNPSPMSLVLDRTCVACRKCALECPTGAIPLTDVTRCDGDKCICCLRCVSVCPVRARHQSPKAAADLEERLRERCAGRKANKLYI